MPREEIKENKKDFIDSYYVSRSEAINFEKRKRVKKLSTLRFSLLTINHVLSAIAILILGSVLLFSISSLSNIEQLYTILNSDDGSIRAAMESAAVFAGSEFVDEFFILYDRKVEFILLLIVLPGVLIIFTLIANILFGKFVKKKTAI